MPCLRLKAVNYWKYLGSREIRIFSVSFDDLNYVDCFEVCILNFALRLIAD